MKSFTHSDIANFVIKFLSDNGSEELVEKWNTQENIEAFNAVKSSKNSPKRGKSSYIFFCADVRPQVKEDLGEDAKGMIMSELGKRWKELKEDKDRADELANYTKMAEDDKIRYQPALPKKQVKKKPTYKKEECLKKKTGYSYFCSVNRETIKIDNPQMKSQEVTRKLAHLWKELNKDEQKEWSASSAELYTYWKDKIQR